jgi:tetratricopeptide (TPR) repeat protein
MEVVRLKLQLVDHTSIFDMLASLFANITFNVVKYIHIRKNRILMLGALTVGERIILHLAQYAKYLDSYDAPLDISQDGIAAALRISRAHAAIELKKLKDGEDVVEKLVHIKRGKTKRKVYFLTSPGEERGRKILQFATSEGIDIQPFLDLKKCKGPELWSSLDDEQRTLMGQACVFRRPFLRSALPEISVSLLPVDEDGMVDMPPSLRLYVPDQTPSEQLRRNHSAAADYWLVHGDYRERLYHLIKAGRKMEAEMLLASKNVAALGVPDEDLFSIVISVPATNERYRGRILLAQAEVAWRSGNLAVATQKASELKASAQQQDRCNGLMIEGLILRSQGQMDRSLERLSEAKMLSGSATVVLECEMAETLIQAGRYSEAKTMLNSLISSDAKDGEDLERIFFQLGVVSLHTDDPSGAIRYFSKSRGAARNKENGALYLHLSDAYGKIGMVDKAEEYAVRAKRMHPQLVKM